MDVLSLPQLAQLFPLVFAIVAEGIDLLLLIPLVPRTLFLLFMLWVFYLAAMNLLRVHRAGKLGQVALALGLVVIVIGYTLDVLANLIVFTVLLLELPRWREWTVTDRLQRHHGDSTWRAKVAQWFETELLGQFDPDGTHVAPAKGRVDA